MVSCIFHIQLTDQRRWRNYENVWDVLRQNRRNGPIEIWNIEICAAINKKIWKSIQMCGAGIGEANRRSTFTLNEMRDVGSNTENSILPQNGFVSSYKQEQWRQLNGPGMGIPASWREKERTNWEKKDSLFRENRRIGIFYCVAYKHHRQPNQKSMNSTTAIFDWANGYVCIHQSIDFYAAAFLLLCVYYNLTQTLGSIDTGTATTPQPMQSMKNVFWFGQRRL